MCLHVVTITHLHHNLCVVVLAKYIVTSFGQFDFDFELNGINKVNSIEECFLLAYLTFLAWDLRCFIDFIFPFDFCYVIQDIIVVSCVFIPRLWLRYLSDHSFSVL